MSRLIELNPDCPIDCAICLTDHDPEIHEATERLHQAWRERILLCFVEIPVHARPAIPQNDKETIGVIPQPMRNSKGKTRDANKKKWADGAGFACK